MLRNPRSRLLFAGLLILLAACLGVVAALGGAWLTAVVMALLIASQIFVYRKAKQELAGGE